MSGATLKRSLQTLSQIVRQSTRFIRRSEHEVSVRREHGNSIPSRHVIRGFSPIALCFALSV